MTTGCRIGSLLNYLVGFFNDLANNKSSEANRKGESVLATTNG
jgi:hypothetical protein